MAYPSQYDFWLTEDGQKMLTSWRRKGKTLREIADKIGVSYATIKNWKKKFPEIKEVLDIQPDVYVADTETALFKSAQGYFVTEETAEQWKVNEKVVRSHIVRHKKWINASVGAQAFILKNRDREHWSDNPAARDVTGSTDKVEIVIDV